MRKILLASVLVSTAMLAGCADPYTGVPLGYATRGDQALTPELIAHEDQDVKPRCERFAKETNPSRGKMAAAQGWNGLIAGAAGLGLGTVANAKIGGVHGGLPTIGLAGAAYGALASGVQGAVSGWASVGQIRHGWAEVCLGSDVTGLHYVPPSDGKAVKAGAPPRSYGYHPNPNDASNAPLPDQPTMAIPPQ